MLPSGRRGEIVQKQKLPGRAKHNYRTSKRKRENIEKHSRSSNVKFGANRHHVKELRSRQAFRKTICGQPQDMMKAVYVQQLRQAEQVKSRFYLHP